MAKYWTAERVAKLLQCQTRDDLQAAFPDHGIENLVNKRAIFRRKGGIPAQPSRVKEAPKSGEVPKGWEAGVELQGDQGTLCSGVVDSPVTDWNELLALWNLDPDTFEVIEPVTFKAWDMGIKNPDGEIETKRLYSYKATIRRIVPGVDPRELERLREEVTLLGPATFNPSQRTGDSTFVVCLSDWQIGKGETHGTEATVERIEATLVAAQDRLVRLLTSGERVGQIALVGLGDLFEGCTGFYQMQEYQTDRTRREQTNILRRLLLRYIRAFGEYGLPLVVAAVGGNHGENRRGGKAFTTFGDNDDVAIFEQVQSVVDEMPEAFGSPTFQLAGDDLTLVLELSGVKVGLAHGHQFGTKNQATAWWQKQALGDQPVGQAQILLNGHFHSLDITTWGPRTRIQTPALDGGSQWYRERHGAESPAGMVTLLVGSSVSPLYWGSLEVL